MADHAEVEYATATGNDYAEQKKTAIVEHQRVAWGIGHIVILLILMAYFLV